MNIVEDLQWHTGPQQDATPVWPPLRRLIPTPGEERRVWLSATALQQGAVQRVLWVPPYSELNGWDAQPSEIALSQVVTARLSRTARAPRGDKVECAASILHRVSLLEACDDGVGDMSGESALLPNLQSPVFWDQVRWSGTAMIGDMTFLDCVAGETAMVLLLRRLPHQCSVRYAQLRVNDRSSAALGCWTLEGNIQQAIERQLAASVTLRDTSPSYLTLEDAT
jgi:hypothetical protein